MKKLLSVLLCLVAIVGTLSISANASGLEASKRAGSFRERLQQRERRLNLADQMDYSKYPTLAEIKEVREVNEELRQNNKDLRKELLDTLKKAKEAGLTVSDETKAKIEDAKTAIQEAKENVDFERGNLRNKFERGSLRVKWSDKDFDKEELKEKAANLLEKLNKASERLQERNTKLQELIQKVNEEIESQATN